MNLWTVGCADPRLTAPARSPYGQAGENAMRFPHLAHRSAAAHKLHSTPQQDRMNLISGKGETSSRLPAFSLFLPGSCPNNRDRRRHKKLDTTALYTRVALKALGKITSPLEQLVTTVKSPA